MVDTHNALLGVSIALPSVEVLDRISSQTFRELSSSIGILEEAMRENRAVTAGNACVTCDLLEQIMSYDN